MNDKQYVEIGELLERAKGTDLYFPIKSLLTGIPPTDVLDPPVKIGQPVYAALTYDDEEDVIEEYTVGGVAYIDGEWFIYCEKDPDWYKYDTNYCKPTREEAEAAIAAARSATDIKDGHKNGGAE